MLAMQASPDGEVTRPAIADKPRSPEEWLNALAAGECDRECLFNGVVDAISHDPDSGWELLSLIDQYYRRRRISAEDFHGLNTHLQALLIGGKRHSAAIHATQTGTAKSRTPPPAAAALKSAPAPAPFSSPPPAAAQPSPRPMPRPTPTAVPPAVPPSAKPDPTPRARGATTTVRTLNVNEVLRNRYRVLGVLGRGGMGTVYAAVDQYRIDNGDGGQRIALKVLHTDLIARPRLLEELRSEFQRLQALSHPNIVRVHEIDRDGDLTFFTMEQLSGAPLGRVLASRNGQPLNRAHALSIIQQVATAVAYAHSRGTVHGDLNPGNIFITDHGEIRLLDFGASHRLRADPIISEAGDPTRIAVATPSYASCEALVGSPATTSDDIYALSCISYIMLTGRHPYQGHTALQARAAKLTPRRPTGLADRQWRALKAGLRCEGRQRPADMQAWIEQWRLQADLATLPPLAAVLNTPDRRSYAGLWIGGALFATAAVITAFAFNNPEIRHNAQDLWNSVREAASGTDADETPAPPEPAPVAAPPSIAARSAPTVAAAAAPAHPSAARATPAHEGSATPSAAAEPVPARSRIELAADTLDVVPQDPDASVIVRRRDSLRGDVSFTWHTESGTAKSGTDFAAVSSRTETMLSGQREAHLVVPLVMDPRRRADKSFYVVIDDPSEGARLGARTITQVTIPPTY